MKNTGNYSKTALITGASSGIGRAIAIRLADDGFKVAINYKNASDKKSAVALAKILARKTETITLMADVTKEKEVKKMFEAIRKKFHYLAAVINNAGINQTQSFRASKLEDFNRVLEVNLLGSVLVTKHALPLFEKTRGGRVIFISSANVFTGSRQRAAYIASKAGIIGLSRSLALELAPNILVNTVVPGYINTDMFKKFTVETVSEKIKRIPLRRIGKPEDIAGAVSFLCSDDAAYITGQCLHVNGGLYLS